jgi:hypothetical protein
MRSILFSLSLALAIPTVHSQDIRMTDFSGNYNSPQGQGNVKQFSLADGPTLRDTDVTIQLEETNLLLIVGEDEFSWNDISGDANELKSANWSNLNLNSLETSFQASAQSLQSLSTDSGLNLNQFNIECSLGAKAPEIHSVDHLLNGCLNRQANLDLNLVEINDISGESLVSDLMQTLNVGFPSTLSTSKFENISLAINNNDFSAAVTTKVVINATVRMSGKTYYDIEKEQVRIRIDRARAGFLNVLGRLFDELDKIESESVKVERPWVIIDLAE